MNKPAKIEVPESTLANAMAMAFGEIEAATKDASNPAFKQGGKASKYADLSAVIAAIKPALIRHGLFFTQRPEPSERGVTIETVIGHSSGEEMSLGKLFVPANKNDAQGYGSALTYARRYALVTAFGVPVEDDDGNAAAAAARGQSQEDKVSPTAAEMPDHVRVRIVQLCEAVGGNQADQICRAYNVGAITDLSQAQADAVINRLTEKLAEKAKEAENA